MTRKQSARRPAPSTAKWALLAEAGLPAAVVSASGRLQRTNASLRELLGYTAQELRTLRWADLTHPEDRERAAAALRKLRSGEVVRHREPLRLRHCDGRAIGCHAHLAVTGDPRRGPLLCQLVEAATVSDIPAATTELDAEQLLQSVGDSLTSGFVFQLTGQLPGQPPGPESTGLRFSYLSAGAASLLDLPEQALPIDASLLLGQLAETDRQQLLRALQLAQHDHTPVDLQLRHKTSSGASRWLHLRAIARRPPGPLPRWEGVVLDITEREATGILPSRCGSGVGKLRTGGGPLRDGALGTRAELHLSTGSQVAPSLSVLM